MIGDHPPPTTVHSVLGFAIMLVSKQPKRSWMAHDVSADNAPHRQVTDLSTSVDCVSYKRMQEGLGGINGRNGCGEFWVGEGGTTRQTLAIY